MLMKKSRVKIGRIYQSPDGWEGNCNQCAENLGCTPSNFRTRLSRWGLNDPRTWKHKEELKYKRGGPKRDENIYESPGMVYRGTIDEVVAILGITRQCFIRRLKNYGADDIRTWMNQEQAELHRMVRTQLQLGSTAFWWLDKLEWSFNGWSVKVIVGDDGIPRI